MKTLITIRDTVKEFLSKYDRFIIPVVKFLVMLLVLISFNNVMGYSSDMSSGGLMALLSLISAFLPVQLIVLIAGAVAFMHMYAVSLEVAIVYLVLFLLMYLLYLRFAPKYGWLIIVMPIFYIIKLHYIVPIIVGIFLGPVGIVPAAFGVIFYYFTRQVAEYKTLMQMASEENSVQGFSYLIRGMLENKEMLLTIIVFAFVIAATYIIYRQSFKYSWIVAIGSGGILSIVLFLMGGIVLETDTNIGAVFLGSIVGVLIAVVVQFLKGILDYSRIENVQFEDDEYYYYVKAIPKIRMEKQNIKVKRITDTDSEIDQYIEEHNDRKTGQTGTLRDRAAQARTAGAAKTSKQNDITNAVKERQQGSSQTRTQRPAQTGGQRSGQPRNPNTTRSAQNPNQNRTRNSAQTIQNPIPSGQQSSAQSEYTNRQRQAQRKIYDNTRNQARQMNTGASNAGNGNVGRTNTVNPNRNDSNN